MPILEFGNDTELAGSQWQLARFNVYTALADAAPKRVIQSLPSLPRKEPRVWTGPRVIGTRMIWLAREVGCPSPWADSMKIAESEKQN